MKIIYQIHKWLALVFSLPLLVLALTGLMLTIAPKKSPLNIKTPSMSLPVNQVLSNLSAQFPRATFMRANFDPKSVTVMMREKDISLITLDREMGSVLSKVNPRDDIFILSKIIHESFLLDKVGKKIVGICGLMLFLILVSGTVYWLRSNVLFKIKNLYQLASFKKIKKIHVLIGFTFLIPLIFTSLSGALIELNTIFMSDNSPREHIVPTSCSLSDQLEVISKLPLGEKGMLMFCRPGNSYLMWNGADGIRQLTPKGEEVLFVPKNDWAGNAGTRKHWFVHWHGGENFGAFESVYRYLTAINLLILVLSGIYIWFFNRRRSHQ